MTKPNDATRAEEDKEATAAHSADRPPTDEEAELAPEKASAETAKDYDEMAKTGAQVKGEGELP
ncbi:MAG TPA: hypothetical protein VG435_14975 [Acidimicrobiales bacterium]|jgi:hypothetical protein|nr:hypothetical protein [Acidimicrobiales bacterium]